MAAQVLLVDDSPDFIAPTRTFLEESGFGVTEAHNGLEALERVAEHPPDLIILDVAMPKLDGWGTLAALQGQEATAEIPVLMLTACNGADSVKQGYDMGCTWFYPKPIVDFQDLLLVVQRIIDVAESEGEAASAG